MTFIWPEAQAKAVCHRRWGVHKPLTEATGSCRSRELAQLPAQWGTHTHAQMHTAERQWDTQLLLGQRHPQQFAMIFGAQRLVLRNFYVFIIIQMESTLPQRHATCHTHEHTHSHRVWTQTKVNFLMPAPKRFYLVMRCDAVAKRVPCGMARTSLEPGPNLARCTGPLPGPEAEAASLYLSSFFYDLTYVRVAVTHTYTQTHAHAPENTLIY